MTSIKITINKDSEEIQIEGIGYRNHMCVKDIDEITKSLNAIVIGRKAKPEMVQLVGDVKVG